MTFYLQELDGAVDGYELTRRLAVGISHVVLSSILE